MPQGSAVRARRTEQTARVVEVVALPDVRVASLPALRGHDEVSRGEGVLQEVDRERVLEDRLGRVPARGELDRAHVMLEELRERVVDVPAGGRSHQLFDGSAGVDEMSARRLRAHVVARIDEVEGDVELVDEGHALERRGAPCSSASLNRAHSDATTEVISIPFGVLSTVRSSAVLLA